MFDNLLGYYNEHVLDVFVSARETLSDSEAGRSRDLKAVLASATSLFHYREHIPAALRPSRAYVENKCPDYGLLADIVNASKHGEISNPTPHGAPYINKASQIQEQLWSVEYQDSLGVYRHSIKVVVVHLSNGGERQVLEVLTNVINFWESFNALNSIVSLAPRVLKYDSPGRLRTREECNMGKMNFRIVAGRQFTQFFRWLRFDYEIGAAEPVDLTGSTVRMNFYRPRIEVDLFLNDSILGKEFKETVELFDEEAEEVGKISGETERMNYVVSLAKGREALQKMVTESEQERLSKNLGQTPN